MCYPTDRCGGGPSSHDSNPSLGISTPLGLLGYRRRRNCCSWEVGPLVSSKPWTWLLGHSLWQWAWNWIILKVPSNPNHFVILLADCSWAPWPYFHLWTIPGQMWPWALGHSPDPRTIKPFFSTPSITQGPSLHASRLCLAVGAQSCTWALLASLVSEWGWVNAVFLLPHLGGFVD